MDAVGQFVIILVLYLANVTVLVTVIIYVMFLASVKFWHSMCRNFVMSLVTSTRLPRGTPWQHNCKEILVLGKETRKIFLEVFMCSHASQCQHFITLSCIVLPLVRISRFVYVWQLQRNFWKIRLVDNIVILLQSGSYSRNPVLICKSLRWLIWNNDVTVVACYEGHLITYFTSLNW
jgi:hypothetical protein